MRRAASGRAAQQVVTHLVEEAGRRGGPLGDSILPEARTTHKCAEQDRVKPGTQGERGQGSEFLHKCGAASRSKKPNTQRIGRLEQPHCT